jgi:glycosyltransferase involved in cell wall biosynthesis
MGTVIHVTHEAVRKIGGIGAVLQGLLTSPEYISNIPRTILVGPVFDAKDPLGDGEVLYSSLEGTDKGGYKPLFKPIEEKYHVWIIYGKRSFMDKARDVKNEVEVILVDTSSIHQDRENFFKAGLYRRFGLQSDRYEGGDEFELYMRMAEPAYDAVKVLLTPDDAPYFVISHEFMGMPFVLKALLEKDDGFRVIFYAHEVATIRPIVEEKLGHDTMFYNVLERAMEEGKYIGDVFGDQSGFFKHALISGAVHCDNIFAVGDYVVKELRFLGPEFSSINIDLVYNGVPAYEISLDEKLRSKEKLQRYAGNLLGFKPDYVFSHVTRLVPSKGLWRDLKVLRHLDEMFEGEGKTGVIFFLSTLIGTGRSIEEVLRMEEEYGWPVNHRVGYPDLVGYEADFYVGVEEFNRNSKAIKAVFINQFGWSRDRCGNRMPEDMEFMDIRKGTDIEFGQSIYEPFGIAQVEPISFGAICVISNVCGCAGFLEKATGGEEVPNVIVADYIRLSGEGRSLEELFSIGLHERDEIERRNSLEVAERIFQNLPRTPEQMEEMIRSGYRIGSRMSWDVVVKDYFLPGLERALGKV